MNTFIISIVFRLSKVSSLEVFALIILVMAITIVIICLYVVTEDTETSTTVANTVFHG